MPDTAYLRLGDQATLHYRLICQGEILVDTHPDGPETFTLGHGQIDPRLETLLLGLRAGDQRRFDLAPGEAFGSHDANLIHLLPRTDFPADMELVVGSEIEFSLPNGQNVHGTVLAFEDNDVRVDFNHPLAGLPVNFEVEILAIQDSAFKS